MSILWHLIDIDKCVRWFEKYLYNVWKGPNSVFLSFVNMVHMFLKQEWFFLLILLQALTGQIKTQCVSGSAILLPMSCVKIKVSTPVESEHVTLCFSTLKFGSRLFNTLTTPFNPISWFLSLEDTSFANDHSLAAFQSPDFLQWSPLYEDNSIFLNGVNWSFSSSLKFCMKPEFPL